jgi:CRP-like cAMP-binding protein
MLPLENSSMQALITHFARFFRLGIKEKNELPLRFTERKLRRRTLILRQGEVCRHFIFVVVGCVKLYAVDHNGKEHILEFAAENDWLCDLSSFYSSKPSDVFIATVEPSVILQIKHADLIYLYCTYPKFNTNFRIVTEHKNIALQRRVLQNISSTAEERYLSFIEQYPQLVNRLPNTQIASYLGITSEFLSKIRKDLASRR